jgi:hypothetical protein
MQNKIIDMKKNFTLIRLIVKNKNNTYKLCLFKKYTLKNNLYNDFNSKFNNYGSATFYNIGFKMESGGTTDNKMEVDNEMKVDNEMEIDNFIINEETTNENENDLKILEFCDEIAYFDNKNNEYGAYDEYDNLYGILKKDIRVILFQSYISAHYFDDFYNILLYYFYFENEVFYGEELKSLIKIITNEILDEEKIEEIRIKQKKAEKSLQENKSSQSVDLKYFASLPKQQKRSLEPSNYELTSNDEMQKVGGFKKNKNTMYNKKKQIKKKNKQTKKKNKQTKKKNKQTKKKNKQTKKKNKI